ncbi:MAG: hypothetical protein ACPLZY_00380 [Candidatus Norongarragalinales archaeon]
MDNRGKLLILVGIIFLAMGLLSLATISESYPWLCGIGFLFGVPLTCVGFLVEIEFYSDSSFLGKVSSVIVTASLVFVAGFLMVISYRVVVGSRIVPIISHGYILGWKTIPITATPYGWLALPLFVVGVILLVFGVALRIFSEVM